LIDSHHCHRDFWSIVAIDTEAGLLCQSRDQQTWNGSRSAKGVTGKGRSYCILAC